MVQEGGKGVLKKERSRTALERVLRRQDEMEEDEDQPEHVSSLLTRDMQSLYTEQGDRKELEWEQTEILVGILKPV